MLFWFLGCVVLKINFDFSKVVDYLSVLYNLHVGKNMFFQYTSDMECFMCIFKVSLWVRPTRRVKADTPAYTVPCLLWQSLNCESYSYRSQQSSSGVAGDRSTLSFSGSAPGADTSLNKSGGPLIDMNKSGNTNPASESGIARSSRPSSSGASSSTLTHKEDAGTRAAVYSPDEGQFYIYIRGPWPWLRAYSLSSFMYLYSVCKIFGRFR